MKILIIIVLLLNIIIVDAKPLITSDVLSYYNPNQTIDLLDKETAFWESKLDQQYTNPSYHQKLAQTYSMQFDVKGRIEDLKKAEYHYRFSIKFAATTSSAQLRNLAHNLITQHRFCEALYYLEEAYCLGAEKSITEHKLFDVYLELGEDALAYELLQKIEEGDPIQYKIRLAKWEDKNGRLDNAIISMESALADARQNKDLFMLKWLYSNLGDFYGHAGRLDDSKNAYIAALKLNNADWYALKGLAWIAFSADSNFKITNAILRLIDKNCESPSIDLFSIELMKAERDALSIRIKEKQLYNRITSDLYGGMYNGFKINYLLENQDFDNAIFIAEEEIEGRATPETYGQYARALYYSGNEEMAVDVYIKEVRDKTFEPSVLLDMLEVTQGYEPDHEILKSELLGTRYELGPVDYRLVEKAHKIERTQSSIQLNIF